MRGPPKRRTARCCTRNGRRASAVGREVVRALRRAVATDPLHSIPPSSKCSNFWPCTLGQLPPLERVASQTDLRVRRSCAPWVRGAPGGLGHGDAPAWEPRDRPQRHVVDTRWENLCANSLAHCGPACGWQQEECRAGVAGTKVLLDARVELGCAADPAGRAGVSRRTSTSKDMLSNAHEAHPASCWPAGRTSTSPLRSTERLRPAYSLRTTGS